MLNVRLNDHTKEVINGISTLLELVTDKAIEWVGQKCIRRVHNELRGNLKDSTVINIDFKGLQLYISAAVRSNN